MTVTLAGMAERAGRNCDAKGFRDDWHDATGLEDLADAIRLGHAETLTDATADWLDRVAESHRIMVLMTKLALVAGEAVGEAADELRRGGFANLDHGRWADELADVHIRMADLSSLTGVDIDAAVDAKLAKNETRPYKHGKAF